jgi:hypothetical protein
VRRGLAALLALLALAAGIFALGRFFTARDDAGVRAVAGPGQAVRDACARHGTSREEPASRPPTSGTHRPRLPRRDGRAIGDDELLHALELGNVVLAYRARTAPAALRRLQEELAGPYEPAVAEAGQAVILARREDAGGVVALAWARLQRAGNATDPALRTFAEHWLGRGYAEARGPGCPAPG